MPISTSVFKPCFHSMKICPKKLDTRYESSNLCTQSKKRKHNTQYSQVHFNASDTNAQHCNRVRVMKYNIARMIKHIWTSDTNDTARVMKYIWTSDTNDTVRVMKYIGHKLHTAREKKYI